MNTTQTSKLAGIALAALLAAPLAQGGGRDDWTKVESLKHGTRIGVVQDDRKQVEGRFESASPAALTLESGGVRSSIAQDKVIRVYKIGMSRKKRMLIGTAVGVAAGVAVAAALAPRFNNEGIFGGPNGGVGAAVVVAGSAGVGLAVGGLTGNRHKTIYEK